MSRRQRIEEKNKAETEMEKKISELPDFLPKPYAGKKIKTFIISYNRLSFLKQQIEFLSQNPFLDLYIIDNCSTYEPLEEYYQSIKHDFNVIGYYENIGHTVIWQKEISKNFAPDEPYIVTDNDIIPDQINFHELLLEGLEKYPDINKIGLGLHTDDLPVNIPFRKDIIQHEEMQKEYMDDLRFAKMPVDTTMAIYRAGYHHYSVWGTDSVNYTGECKSLRTTHPKWKAKHLPWYLTQEQMQSEENKFYFNSLKKNSTHWSQLQSLTTI